MIGFLAFFLLLLPAATSAQSGVVLFDRAVQYGFEVPERLEQFRDQLPSANISSVLLLFNESASLMVPAPAAEEAEPEEQGPGRRTPRTGAFVSRLRLASPSRSDQETLLEAHMNLQNGTITETREFMGRKFLIAGNMPRYEWRLSAEQSQFLGYVVQKATATHDSTEIEAWFTPEIPVSTGPSLFSGLPGLILSVSVDSGQTVYSATEVNLASVEDAAIKAPDDGQEVTRDEYEQIVAEKLEELRMRRRGRRRRP